METEELHYQEANRAREHYDSEASRLRRLLWLRALVMTVLGLIVYAHCSRIYSLNASVRAFGSRTPAELASTVTSFLANHRKDQNYVLQPDEDALALQKMLAQIGSVMQTELTLASHGKVSLRELLQMAEDRPRGIKVTLPYMGEVTLPLSFGMLALICIAAGIFGNLFIILRQEALDSLEDYISGHLSAASSATAARQGIDFRADPGAETVHWPVYLDGRPRAQLFFELLSGLSFIRLKQRRFNLLLEGGSACVTALLVVGVLGLFAYLQIEFYVGRAPSALNVILSALLGTSAAILGSLGLARVGYWLFVRWPAKAAKRRAAA